MTPSRPPTSHADAPPEKPHRMTLSQVVESLLQRGGSEHSSVTLTRNAKGETQIEVVVRTGDAGEVQTITDAEIAATAVYARLRELYPFGAEPAGGNGEPRSSSGA